MTFGEKVDVLLARSNRSQGDLAAEIGTTQQVVSTWVSRGVIPNTKFALQIARYLGVTVDYLLDESQAEPAAGLSESERLFLVAVREMGYERAMRVIVRAIPQDEAGLEQGTAQAGQLAKTAGTYGLGPPSERKADNPKPAVPKRKRRVARPK